MNYVPLYRKYRPQKLEEIVGQSHIKKALTNAIALDKISHAYLFTGPRGTGKTSTARILAKSLNCKKGPTATPCGECENCIDITNSTPMDVREIDAASHGGVDDTRKLLEQIIFVPTQSRYLIYIIDEVHMLSTQAFNALLKTLEEPPKNVIFILATTEVHKVLDTIKSRCQRFDFKRITTDDIIEHLKMIAKKEKIKITDEALSAIAKNSAGGMRDSIALLDQLAVLGDVSIDDINNLLGRISFDILAKLTDKIIASNPQEAIEIAEEIYNNGSEPGLILSGLADYFKNLLIAKNCSETIARELTQAAQFDVLKKQAAKLDTHQIIFLIDKSAQYIREIKAAANPRLWLEVAVIDLANLADNTSLVELQNRIAALEGNRQLKTETVKLQAAPVPAPVKLKDEPAPIPASVPTPAAMPTPASSATWEQLLDNTSPAAKPFLKQNAQAIKISPEETIIEINELWFEKFTAGNKKQVIVEALDKIFSQTGSNVIIKLAGEGIKEKSESPAPASAPEPESTPEPTPAPQEEEPEKPAASDQVNMVVDLFGGKILD